MNLRVQTTNLQYKILAVMHVHESKHLPLTPAGLYTDQSWTEDFDKSKILSCSFLTEQDYILCLTQLHISGHASSMSLWTATSVGPLQCITIKCLNSLWIHCHEMGYRHQSRKCILDDFGDPQTSLVPPAS